MLARIVIILCWVAALAAPQQPPANIAPPENLPPPAPARRSTDMNLVFAFFRFHLRVSDEIDRRVGAAPASAAALQQAIANLLRVNFSEFAQVTRVAGAAKAAVDQVDAEAERYYREVLSRRQRPEISVLEKYEARRQAAVRSAMSELQAVLTPTGWAGLTAFLDHGFEGQFVRRLSAAKQQPVQR